MTSEAINFESTFCNSTSAPTPPPLVSGQGAAHRFSFHDIPHSFTGKAWSFPWSVSDGAGVLLAPLSHLSALLQASWGPNERQERGLHVSCWSWRRI